MSFWAGLEGNLEKYIEGFFKDKFKGVLEPIDIAKALTREMYEQRRTSLQEIYVPNLYRVSLSARDYDKLQLILEGLAQELAELIQKKAAEKQYTFLGAVQVDWHQDEGMKTGELQVVGSFDETVAGHEDGPQAAEATLRFNLKELGAAAALAAPRADFKATLTVTHRALRGNQFVLGQGQTVVGRRLTCDICLTDDSVSRRHAVITTSGGRYLIKDEASTNGTYVNGVKIQQTQLKPQDHVKLGRVLMVFEVE